MTKISDERLRAIMAMIEAPATLNEIDEMAEELLQLRAHNSDSAEPVGDLHFVFDKMPSPDGCMLIECEDSSGNSVSVGEWRNRQDGLAELVVSQKEITHTFLTAEMTERAVMVFEGELGEADRPSTRLIAEALKAALTNRTPDDEVGNG